jgi:hypothetical protein
MPSPTWHWACFRNNRPSPCYQFPPRTFPHALTILSSTGVIAEVDGRWWEAELRVPFAQFPFTFKYALRISPTALGNGNGITGD